MGFARFVAAPCVALIAVGTVGIVGGESPDAAIAVAETPAVNCSFQVDPPAYLTRHLRTLDQARERALKFSGPASARFAAAGRSYAVPAASLPRRNFIDVEIFDRLERMGVAAAPLSGDEEFLRRVYLDLAGRTPSPAAVRDFLTSGDPNKRGDLIGRLLYSPDFSDKWTIWLGDLLQNNAVASNFNRQIGGRNAMHNWIRSSIAANKPLKDIAWEAVSARGNSFEAESGATNVILGGRSNGPIQDTYDLMFAKTAASWLGMGHYDCLVCHNGRRHLDDLSVWAKTATRIEAQRMAAFFSRTRFTQNTDSASPLFQSTTVTAATTGGYDLNTNFGNRPTRAPVGSLRSLTPEYHFTGAAPPDADWRTAFAENLVRDPMLARNLANRLWKAMFGVALVEPEDSLDPARLDPAKPPEDPGRLAPMQASHPELLERLAAELRAMNYDLREFLRLLADSSAYQLSSRYEGEFRQEHVQLFARHLPRRLEGEEIHDAIARATGVAGRYTVQDWAEPVEWAMLLPEPVEPRSNGAVATFMNAFLRGNRDTQFRSQSGSILQQLNLMNDNFVTSRTRVSASPTLRAVAAIPGNKEAVEELFLLFLSRRPSEYESERAVAMLAQGTTQALRNQRIEDLAWVLINKVEFIFSY